MNGKTILQCLVLLAAFAWPLAGQPRVHLVGRVHAGGGFRKEIGSGLVLVLAPLPDEDSGWTIAVRPEDGSDNFVRCVTLPLHGPTPADLLVTQFVGPDNQKLPESQLTYVKKREFQFVLNAADQKKACEEMEAEAYGSPKTAPDGTVIIGNPDYEEPLLGSASFVIKAARLSNLGAGKHARLDFLTFEVEIMLPANGSRHSANHR